MPKSSGDKKIQKTVRISSRSAKIIDAVAKREGTTPAETIDEYLRRFINELVMKGEIPTELIEGSLIEDFERLKEFLNNLIDHNGDHNFNLAEIADILGRESDAGLLDLVNKLKNRNATK
jgi:hypothetical protein